LTTIAYRDGIIAADTRVTFGGRAHRCTKLYRKTLGAGRNKHDVVLAVAGEASPALLFVDWFGSGAPIPDMLRSHGGDFSCLILTPDGLFEADVFCRPERVLDEFYAIGSGARGALAAMVCGKSAIEAVAVAAVHDIYTGGDIEWMSLERPRQQRRAAQC
jgi:ATP-dependent protease HslVU (ClpYQ) peptidase subunit